MTRGLLQPSPHVRSIMAPEMRSSSRILLLLVAMVTILGGWWILFAINDAIVAIIYGVLWTAVVLVAARVLIAFGFGYNRLTAGRERAQTPRPGDASAALAELIDLRDRNLISAAEYEAKRARILERL